MATFFESRRSGRLVGKQPFSIQGGQVIYVGRLGRLVGKQPFSIIEDGQVLYDGHIGYLIEKQPFSIKDNIKSSSSLKATFDVGLKWGVRKNGRNPGRCPTRPTYIAWQPSPHPLDVKDKQHDARAS